MLNHSDTAEYDWRVNVDQLKPKVDPETII